MTNPENSQDDTSLQTPEEELSKEALSEKELAEAKDKYMRLLAESENTRKRLQKEKMDMMRFSVENIISEFLIPIDNLENALLFAGKASEETANWAKGFQMILGQFKEVLSNNGIMPFVSKGTLFDPHYHEAVETEYTDTVSDGLILEEYVKGYKSKERVIRPSRVKVAKKPISEAQPVPDDTTQQIQEKE